MVGRNRVTVSSRGRFPGITVSSSNRHEIVFDCLWGQRPATAHCREPERERGRVTATTSAVCSDRRGPRVDMVLDDPRVSRRHVYLQFVEGRAFWVDLESRSGTNGDRKSQKFGWLEGEQVLSAGPYVIRRIVSGRRAAFTPGGLPSNTPLVTLAYGDAPPTEVALEFLNGPSQSTSRPVHRVMSLIGSARGCKFRLTDPSVSRFHGSLLRLSTGLWIVDLLGHRGIIVNEVPVRFSRLNDGDVLRIGRYQIRVRCRLRGHEPGTRLPDRSRATHAVRFLRQDNDANGLKFPDWAAATPAAWTQSSVPASAYCSLVSQRPADTDKHLRARELGSIRADRIHAGPLGQSVRRNAAADVRPVPAGDGHDGPDVRDDAP